MFAVLGDTPSNIVKWNGSKLQRRTRGGNTPMQPDVLRPFRTMSQWRVRIDFRYHHACVARRVDHIVIRQACAEPSVARLGELHEHHIRAMLPGGKIGAERAVIAWDDIQPAGLRELAGVADHPITPERNPGRSW